jgi:hypothetical protein
VATVSLEDATRRGQLSHNFLSNCAEAAATKAKAAVS